MGGSNVVPVTVTTDTVISNGPCAYFGFHLRNTSTSATATVIIYDNATGASGKKLDPVELSASESAREWYGPQGRRASQGIYVDVVSGTVEGVVDFG